MSAAHPSLRQGTRETTADHTPPSAKAKSMHVADALHVVVRDLPSQGLEGAFRVHVLPESLEQAHLRVGDVCEISSEDGSTGYGIAWRADDRMGSRPKHRPAKMTECFRSACGFEEGSKVALANTDAKIVRADKIVLSEVTPPEYNKFVEVDDGLWQGRVISLFVSCEALAPGIGFDVIGKKKFRKRFYIESIEGSCAPEGPCLFSYVDRTQLVFHPAPSRPYRANPNGVHTMANGSTDSSDISEIQLSTERMGGLLEQSAQLNVRLRRLLKRTADTRRFGGREPHNGILIHGYEGTGKSLLLDSLEHSGFQKVIRLTRSDLIGGTVSKNQEIIQKAFKDASAYQPALILMDDLDELVPHDDATYGRTLITELKRARGSRVIVVAATRSISSIKSSLIGMGGLASLIELPIPDAEAREQILNILRGIPAFAKDSVSSKVAARTHAFTGKDLDRLYDIAVDIGYERHEKELEDAATAKSPTPPAYKQAINPKEASDHIVPTDFVTIDDFEVALRQIKPTALREIFTVKPKTTWADIGGSEQVQRSFDRIIGWPQRIKHHLVTFKYQPPKGLLLYGPPGCSKTLTAQAVANTYHYNFIAVKGAELINMYVGESERAVRDVFNKAKAASPCVIFFDEIDSIGGTRDMGGAKDLNVLTTLLNEMDGFERLNDVLILAATNKPATLDPALLRPGRFDRHVYLGPPSETARKEIFAIGTKDIPVSNVDFDSLVSKTAGYSGAEIMSIVSIAKERALVRICDKQSGDERITAADFEEAIKEVPKSITREIIEAYEAFSRRG